PNYLYINDGTGAYLESAQNYGVDDVGCGLAIATTDINNDGIMDIYIANDFGEWIVPNTAYINNFPNKNFTNVSLPMNLNVGVYGMGIAVGDIDNDLDNDFYITNLGRNVLLKNNSLDGYQDVSSISNVENDFNNQGQRLTSWGALFLDMDNDSDLDLFVSNGYVPAAPFLNVALSDPNKFFINDGDGVFTDISSDNQESSEFFNRGAIYGDYDNDGDLDIFTVSVDGRVNSSSHSLFYTNQLSNSKNWIEILLEGEEINRDALGSKVTVYSDQGIFMRENYGGGTFGSQNSKILHFGLNNSSSIEKVVVRWSHNNTQIFTNLPLNQRIYLKENNNNFKIVGCMDTSNPYYNKLATYNMGCFVESKFGCTDLDAINYNPNAIYDDGDCMYNVTVSNEADSELSDNIFAYPNTFNNELFVSFLELDKHYDICIYDMKGDVIYTIESNGKKSIRIDTSDYRSGVYILRINSQENAKPSRIIKLIKN
ncbi:MAG: FG-GAP-like repeat-containing protein, partial [Fulvivirga sp.]|uniref:ASPIC/UnbV domain-containing protein n=1 Tax=Fulvivirga sp. TaxID=1931237 RepID=UPI0032EB1145